MLYVRLMGGLGNQMFQYAFARAYALKNRSEVALDLSFLKNKKFHKSNTPREYELDLFSLDIPLVFESPVSFIDPLNRYFRKLMRIIRGNKLLEEHGLHFHPEFLSANTKTLAIGYFQSEKYFKEIEEQLRKDFVFKNDFSSKTLELAQEVKNFTSVSLHIRRGDYVAQGYHEACPISYYEKGLSLIAQQAGEIKVYIFSDDILWVKENFKCPYSVFYVGHNEGKRSFEDMYLMSQCAHHIIANSSFSWWGAWLNPSTSKIVIAPKTWSIGAASSVDDIIPESWIKL